MTILLPEGHDIKKESISKLQKWLRQIEKVRLEYPDLPGHARIRGIPYTVGEVVREIERRAGSETKVDQTRKG